jgi:hypothetical protein
MPTEATGPMVHTICSNDIVVRQATKKFSIMQFMTAIFSSPIPLLKSFHLVPQRRKKGLYKRGTTKAPPA